MFILVPSGDHGPTLGLDDGVLLGGEGVVGGAGAPRPAVDVERVQLAGIYADRAEFNLVVLLPW